jgi:hypothetical protein
MIGAEGGPEKLIALPRFYLAILKILKFRRSLSFLTRSTEMTSALPLGIKWAANKLLTE